MSGNRSRQAGVMVQGLVILAGLVTLIAVLVADQRVAFQTVQRRRSERRAEIAARSAVQQALAALQQANPALTTPQDIWATLGNEGATSFELQGATYRLQVLDAGSRINVNAVTQEQLQLLPITQEQAESLLDWREPGQQARPNGAKDAYYNGLEQPYNARLGPLPAVSVLLLVRGWTAQALYEPQTDVVSTALNLEDEVGEPLPLIDVLTAESGAPNQQADGTARVNLNQQGVNAATFIRMGVTGTLANQLAAGAPYTSFAALLTRPGINANVVQTLLNTATFTTETRLTGKININRASQAVLETVPGMTPDIASAIVNQQTNGFQNLGELSTLPGMTTAVLARCADTLTVGSDTWIVRAYGESGGVGVAFEAVVGSRNNQVRVLTWQRLPDSGVPAWWNWQDTSETAVDAGSEL